MNPRFVRAAVPVDITFQLVGTAQAVRFEIAGKSFDCDPLVRPDGRRRCVHPGLMRQAFTQGITDVVVAVTDAAGRTARASDQITIDFDCPRIVSAVVDRSTAQPGDDVALTIEASEALSGAPTVTRAGVPWAVPLGDGRAFSLIHRVTASDAAGVSPIIVRGVDPAGNATEDCSGEGRVPLSIDVLPPVVNANTVQIRRGSSMDATTLEAAPGSFIDDVQVQTVHVTDPDGTELAVLRPAADGSIPTTPIAGQTRGRVQVQAVDRFGRRSAKVTVQEQWRLSLGSATDAQARIQTGTRHTIPPPTTRSMRTQTVALAPAVASEDARAAVVTGAIGFRQVGSLPLAYENANNISAAYDPVGRAVVTVGGYRGSIFDSPRLFANWLNDVTVIRWDETLGRYRVEQGPSLSRTSTSAPTPLYGTGLLAFDQRGCGYLNSGIGVDFTRAPWLLCANAAGGYDWTPLTGFEARGWPVVYDPVRDRFISVERETVYFIEPGRDSTSWRSDPIPVPSNYGQRPVQVAYYDPVLGGLALGLEGEDFLSYFDDRWIATQAPDERSRAFDVGWAYDTSRKQLAVWGGGVSRSAAPDPSVHFLVETSTNSLTGWRESTVDAPRGRFAPTMVYDSDRQVYLIFGGYRYHDRRTITAEFYQLTPQPSLPMMQATIDLASPRPGGVSQLELTVRARARGDADGVGPGTEVRGGFQVWLWDHQARRWQRMTETAADAASTFERAKVVVTETPSRFVSDTGAIDLTVLPSSPATEAVESRLEVDVIEGRLTLAPRSS